MQPQRKRVQPHDRYRKGVVCQQRVVYGVQADQAPSAKSILTDPKIVHALHAVSFHCHQVDLAAFLEQFRCFQHAKLNIEGLPEGVFETLTSQEQADLVSVAFVDKVAIDVMRRVSIALSKSNTQQSVQDVLSLATVAAAFQQVLVELQLMCLQYYSIYIRSRATMPCFQVSSSRLVDICYTTQIGWFLVLAKSMCKQLVRYCCRQCHLQRYLCHACTSYAA